MFIYVLDLLQIRTFCKKIRTFWLDFLQICKKFGILLQINLDLQKNPNLLQMVQPNGFFCKFAEKLAEKFITYKCRKSKKKSKSLPPCVDVWDFSNCEPLAKLNTFFSVIWCSEFKSVLIFDLWPQEMGKIYTGKMTNP